MKEKLSIVRCSSYDEKEVYEAVRKSVGLIGGISSFIGKGDKVLLKINQLYAAHPDKAVTTHPAIVKAVITLVREAGAKPYVGDSPGFGSFLSFAKVTGIRQAAEEAGAELVELDKPKRYENGSGKVFRSFELSARLEEFDKVISLPKLKTHSMAQFTGAVKNLFGCIPGKLKAQMHIRLPDPMDFSEMLLDLYLLIKPNLTIMDGIVSMEGNGPGAGNPRKISLLIAGTDALSVDCAAVEITGLKGVPIIRIAKKWRFPSADKSNISFRGKYPEDVKIKNFIPAKKSIAARLPRFLYRFTKGLFLSRPVLIKSRCIGCRRCLQSCPRGAISFKRKQPVFDYSRCIRCYCCQELCPEKAIAVKHSFIIEVCARIKSLYR